MDMRGVPESTNYVDNTNPTGLAALKNYVGTWLYTHGVVNGAGGKPYNPQVPIGTPFGGQPRNVPIGPDGRRSDIDWGSNASIPGGSVGLASGGGQQQQNDAMARRMGFKDAATAAAYYQKQQQMRSSNPPATSGSGSAFQQLFAMHPSVLLGHVLDKWNQATGGQ